MGCTRLTGDLAIGDSGMGWDLAVTNGIPCEYRNSWDLDGFLDVHSLLTTFFCYWFIYSMSIFASFFEHSSTGSASSMQSHLPAGNCWESQNTLDVAFHPISCAIVRREGFSVGSRVKYDMSSLSVFKIGEIPNRTQLLSRKIGNLEYLQRVLEAPAANCGTQGM